MSRKLVTLTLDHLVALGAPCRDCLFWELDPVQRRRVSAQDVAAEKGRWMADVQREWGSCGRALLIDDRPVGYVIYAPAALVRGAAAFPTAPVSADAILLTTVHVTPRATGGGLGRILIQGMARDLIGRGGIHAVEAFADARPEGLRRLSGMLGGGPDCVLPVDFLSGVGFKTHRAHAVTPRMRMDLRATLTWRDEVELALDRILGAVRPAGRPAPGPAAREAEPRGTR